MLTDGATTTGSFTSNLTGLSPNSTYYVAAYATNSSGTTYGTPISFTTAATPTIVYTSGTQNPAVCSNNGTVSTTVYTYGGSATGANVTNLPAGLTSAVNTGAQTVTISGTATAGGTYTITTTGGPCSAASINGTVTYNPVSTIAFTSGAQNQTVCPGTGIVSTVYTYGGGATNASVNWGTVTGLSSAVNTGLKTVTISGSATAAGTYTITTSGSAAPCVEPNIQGTITVTTPNVTNSPATGVGNNGATINGND